MEERRKKVMKVSRKKEENAIIVWYELDPGERIEKGEKGKINEYVQAKHKRKRNTINLIIISYSYI